MLGKLTHYKLCPRSRSIRLALGELGLEVLTADENPWEWRQGFLAKNPAGELPVLDLENGLTLCGVYSISEYLSESGAEMAAIAPGRRTELFPGHLEERAEVRRLVDWFHGKFDREVSRDLLNEKVYQSMRAEAVSPDINVLRAARANLRYHLSYISFLGDTRRWLAGDELSFADLAAAGHVSMLDYLGEVPWGDYPPAKAWYQRIKSRPTFRSVLADRVPGTPPPQAYADLDF
jgi:glutathione S-transferase